MASWARWLVPAQVLATRVTLPVIEVPARSRSSDLSNIDISTVLGDPPEHVLTAKVFDLLLAVPGVAKCSSFGGEVRQLQVQVDPEKLRAYDLALTDVATQLRLQLSPRSILRLKLDFYDDQGNRFDAEARTYLALALVPTRSPATDDVTNSTRPIGGVARPIVRFTHMIIAKCTGCTP